MSIRLPNSISLWNDCGCPLTGTYDPSKQRGQVGQPRPDAVTLTRPPVTTITDWATTAAPNTHRRVRADGGLAMPEIVGAR